MEGDATVLGAARSRKELRSAVGVKLVRMDGGESDKRDVEWNVKWGEEEEEEESREEEEEEDTGSDKEEAEQPGRGQLRKRKVSFAVESGKRRR